MVTGEGKKPPSEEYLVSLPGAYQDTGQLSLDLSLSTSSGSLS